MHKTDVLDSNVFWQTLSTHIKPGGPVKKLWIGGSASHYVEQRVLDFLKLAEAQGELQVWVHRVAKWCKDNKDGQQAW